MKKPILIDTGPLVALINRRESSHQWVRETSANLAYPFLTCEAVITEACFLLQNIYGGNKTIMELVQTQKVIVPFHFNQEVKAIQDLMENYQSVPMSFADACLVRMSELIVGSSILTLDSDFYIYRKNRKEPLDLIIPE